MRQFKGLLILLWPVLCIGAQTNPPSDAATFRAETNLVTVHFQVTPKKGKPTADLRAEDIELREDGVRQKIAVFQGGRANPQAAPVEVNLLFADSQRAAALERADHPPSYRPTSP